MYNKNDVVMCIDASAENHEDLVDGRYYRVEGATLFGNDVVYPVRDLVTGDLKYSIDRFILIGQTIYGDESIRVGDIILCIENKNVDLTLNRPYTVTETSSSKTMVGVKDDTGCYVIYSRNRFVLIVGNRDDAPIDSMKEIEEAINTAQDLCDGKIKVSQELIKEDIKNGTREHIYPDRAVHTDMVNHPAHYNQYRMEVLDIIEDATKGMEGFQGMLLGNTLKYMLRFRFKNGVEDLKKARFYLDRLIEQFENYFSK